MSRDAAGAASGGTVWNSGSGAYRLGLGLGIAAVVLLFWITGAVGIIGSEDHPANVMYLGVVGLAVVGSLVSRFRPDGLAVSMFAAAAAVVLIGAVAIVQGLGLPGSPPLELAGLTGFFAGLFGGSGLLFRRAARPRAVA